jgi:hypothetical protein
MSLKDEAHKSMRCTFRLYREAAERRKHIKLPTTEAEMEEMAKKFARENWDILEALKDD